MTSELFKGGVLWHHLWEKAIRPKFDVVRDSCFVFNIHEYLIYYWSEDSCGHQIVIYVPSYWLGCELKMIVMF